MNRIVLITGASSGYGKATAKAFKENGDTVIMTARDAARLEAARAEVGGDLTVPMDVTVPADWERLVQLVQETYGRLDILVNNAGIWRRPRQISLLEMDEDFWKQTVDINLTGVYRVIKQVLPFMLEQQYGRIINLGSIAGEAGLPGYSDYAAAKAGVIMLTKTLAMELGKENITVNCVSPGLVSDIPGETRPHNGTWLGRNGERDEIAEAIVFLASDNSSFMTGVDLTVDGGRILGPRFADFKLEK